MNESWVRALRYGGLLIAGAVVMMLLSRPGSGPPRGEPAPAFELFPVGESSPMTLSNLRGTPVLVEVFASWCGACQRAAPMLAQAASARRSGPVQFVGVSVDDNRQVAQRVKQAWQIPYPVCHDNGRFAQAYGIKTLPTLILIDADGRVQEVATGAPSPDTLERWLSSVGARRL